MEYVRSWAEQKGLGVVTMNRFVTAITCLAIGAGLAFGAEPPALVGYQGVLRDASDRPLNGTYDLIFRFVDAPSGGTLLLTDYHTGPSGVVVSGGLFATFLGGGMLSPGTESTIQSVFSNHASIYVEVQVGAETLSPRVQVGSAGYALNAGRVGGVAAGDFLDKSGVAQTKTGQLMASGGLVGYGSGASPGVEGTSATGYGVKGSATSGSGTNYGLYGVSVSSSGTGVMGETTAASGSAWGVYGKTASGDGVGVVGSALASAGNTEGVHGQSYSPAGRGVVGAAFATSGSTSGVYGESQSPDGTGVWGRATAGSGGTTGVGGESWSPIGTGVAGVAHATSGDAWGIYGATTSPTGWGIVADGGLAVSGDLYVTGAKDFIMEHPTEPGMSIRYSCIEGGEVGVYQRGTARLEGGRAQVTLPSHFPLVASGGITVQVTPLEACGGLYVPEDSVGPSGFAVRESDGGTSGAKFSYLVMAERAGYEGREPVRPVSIGDKILISRHLGVDQRASLRSALGRVGENRLDAGTRSSVLTSLQRGDFDETCRLLGGCASRQAVSPATQERDRKPRLAAEGVSSVSRPAPAAEIRDVAPETRIEAPTQAIVPAIADAAGIPACTLQRVLLAEPRRVSEPVETGDVVVLDQARGSSVHLGTTPLDPSVLGIVADVPGAVLAGSEAPVALIGTVLCKVDAGYGPIAVGDLLVTSATPGHAMRVMAPPPGTILGKALEPLDAGAGLIRVLVMPR